MSFNDVLSADKIRSYLTLPLRIEYYDEITSTNTVLKERAEAGEIEGLVLAAGCQTAGKGRMGNRKFHSPDAAGVYFSILLRPDMPAERAVHITTAAAAAAARAVESVSGRDCGIKWVNDLYMDGRKVCGILTEASFAPGGGLKYAVLGIGINVYDPDGGYPEEIRDIAGSVFGTERQADARVRIIAAVLDNFMEYYYELDRMTYLGDYRARSVVVGKEITVLRGDERYTAEAVGIDEECRLIVRLPDGRERVLDSGEISVRL